MVDIREAARDEQQAFLTHFVAQDGLVRQLPTRIEALIQLAYQPRAMTAFDGLYQQCDAGQPTSILHYLVPVPLPVCTCATANFGGDGWPRRWQPTTYAPSYKRFTHLWEGLVRISGCVSVTQWDEGKLFPTAGKPANFLDTNILDPSYTPTDRRLDGAMIGLDGLASVACTPEDYLHPCIQQFCQFGRCGRSVAHSTPAYIPARDASCHGPNTCHLEASASTKPTCDYRNPVTIGGVAHSGCGLATLALAPDGADCTVNAPVPETGIDGTVHRLVLDGNRVSGGGGRGRDRRGPLQPPGPLPSVCREQKIAHVMRPPR
jgi:hypothetical protein